MGEHAGQRRSPARAQELEVQRRDQAAGDVVLTLYADHLALERRQPTVGEARGPHPPSRPQQVQMGQRHWPASTGQDETRLEQRQVERCPVEGHDAARPLDERSQRRQQRGLVVEVAHEVLDQDQAVFLEPPGAHQERVGAGAAGEASRLRVEEEEPARVLEGRFRPRQHAQQIERRFEGGRERLAPVSV